MAANNLLRTRFNLKQVYPYLLIVAGMIGLLASFVLTYDKIQVLSNPGYAPSCNINPVLSCGSVMQTEQASLLGVPNTIFGIAAFTALITLGFMLAAGAVIKRWLWQIILLVASTGVVFMHYLFFQGVYRINAICPWCFVVWMITIPIFWYTFVYAIREKYIVLPDALQRAANWLSNNHGNVLICWYVVIFVILLERFWYYWQTLL